MKKALFAGSFVFALILVACGPAAENRQVMHARAKVFQDSIANMIRTSMEEAEAPANNVMVMPVQPTAQAQPGAPQAQPANPVPNTGVPGAPQK